MRFKRTASGSSSWRQASGCRQHEEIWLRGQLARRAREREARPELKRADEAIDALLKFGIGGVTCSAKGELLDCPQTVNGLPAVPAAECKEYLKRLGYSDPCPIIAAAKK